MEPDLTEKKPVHKQSIVLQRSLDLASRPLTARRPMTVAHLYLSPVSFCRTRPRALSLQRPQTAVCVDGKSFTRVCDDGGGGNVNSSMTEQQANRDVQESGDERLTRSQSRDVCRDESRRTRSQFRGEYGVDIINGVSAQVTKPLRESCGVEGKLHAKLNVTNSSQNKRGDASTFYQERSNSESTFSVTHIANPRLARVSKNRISQTEDSTSRQSKDLVRSSKDRNIAQIEDLKSDPSPDDVRPRQTETVRPRERSAVRPRGRDYGPLHTYQRKKDLYTDGGDPGSVGLHISGSGVRRNSEPVRRRKDFEH